VGVGLDGKALANGIGGVTVYSASGNVVGGPDRSWGCTLSGNAVAGVFLDGCSGNQVLNNVIGTDPAGAAARANGGFGVAAVGDSGDVVAGNVIAGNVGFGVFLDGSTADVLHANGVGVAASGEALGNSGVGVLLCNGAGDNLIGGVNAGDGNLIAGNGGPGVLIGSIGTGALAGTGNAVLGNRIYANAGIGIDLGPADGVTPNDSRGHVGPNDYQNFPVLASALLSGGQVVIQGTLDSMPSTEFRMEFFASAAADPSGHGPGQAFLGSVDVTTDASGHAAISATLPFASAPGGVITATATAITGSNTATSLTSGDTSEFAADVTGD
jgi:hypothetical protein